MRTDFDAALQERLMRYAAIDSQSDETSDTQPSTTIQLDMSNMLVDELTSMGAQDVTLTEYGVVLATVPGTANGPTIGFCSHVDTAPAYNATNVKPRVHLEYDGSPIRFPDAPEMELSPQIVPFLGEKIGCDIITASGATLLGADDKAGIAIIMTMAQHLLETPSLAHGPVRLAFTSDEEIGRGVDPRLPEDFAVDFAYTLDGSKPGEIEYESFSADGAEITIKGISFHPGWAKDRLVNALHIAAKIIDTLPQSTMTPETTEGRDGFWHIHDMSGTAAEARIKLILRDFELDGLEAKGAMVRAVCDAIAATETRATITCTITPQYRNMRYWLEDDMTPVDLARDACRDAGLEPVSMAIRGGTDGSRLTEMGVPCPNIFTGQQEIHGPLEWIAVQDMALATQVCLALVQRAARS